MNPGQLLALKQRMLGINIWNGTTNCALVALRLDEILNTPEIQHNFPVAMCDPDGMVYTKPILSKTSNSIVKSFCEDPRIKARCNPYLHEDTVEVILIDESNEELLIAENVRADIFNQRAIVLCKANYENINQKLCTLPRRNKDGSAHGFVIYTHKGNNSGHIANFLISSDNKVFFLDAQNQADPDTFISNTPASGYINEIFFIQSIPTEGFQKNNKLKITTGDLHMKTETTISIMGQTTITRKRKKTARLQVDMSAASRGRYPDGSEAEISRFDSAASMSSNPTAVADPVKKVIDLINLSIIVGAINTSDNSILAAVLTENFDLNQAELKFHHGKKYYNSFITYAIDIGFYNIVETLIKFDAKATLVDLQNVINTRSMDSDCIDAILGSLAKQKITIPEELIQATGNKKRPRSCGAGFIPALVVDFRDHNKSILSPGLAFLSDAAPSAGSSSAAESSAAESSAAESSAAESSAAESSAAESSAAASSQDDNKLPIKKGDYIEIFWSDDNKYYPCIVIRFNHDKTEIRVCYDDKTWAWEKLENLEYKTISTQRPAETIFFIDPENGQKYRLLNEVDRIKQRNEKLATTTTTSSSTAPADLTASAASAAPAAASAAPTIAIPTNKVTYDQQNLSPSQLRQRAADDRRAKLFTKLAMEQSYNVDDVETETEPEPETVSKNGNGEVQMITTTNANVQQSSSSSPSAAANTYTQPIVIDYDGDIAAAEKVIAEAEERIKQARQKAEELKAIKRQKVEQQRVIIDDLEKIVKESSSLETQILDLMTRSDQLLRTTVGKVGELRQINNGKALTIDMAYIDQNPGLCSATLKQTLIDSHATRAQLKSRMEQYLSIFETKNEASAAATSSASAAAIQSSSAAATSSSSSSSSPSAKRFKNA